tara:strand:+ start:88 stop:1938 length:1851 start_codon:yes stop_codon:yes gene_type:complete
MCKKNLRKIIIFIPTLVSLILVSFLWDNINFNYTNPNEVIGYYSIFKHSHWNDNIRYVVFIGLPLITYLITILLNDKLSFNQIKSNFLLHKTSTNKDSIPKFYLFFLFFLLILFFISGEFNKNPLDLFHEGQALMGGLNYEIKNKLWSGNFVTTSLFVDILSSKFAWVIFDIQSISSYRLYITLITLITTSVIFIFLFFISDRLNLNKNSKTFIFLILSCFCYFLAQSHTWSYREIPIFIYLILLIHILNEKKISLVATFILGSLPLLSILWSLDRGVFLIASYFPLIVLFFINERFKELLSILLVSVVSFIIFFLIIGPTEFIDFTSNSINILKSSDLLNGIIHPTPFTSEAGSSRATKALLIILINGIIVISLFFNTKSNLDKNHKIFLLIFYFFSIVFYKVGLTRSDGGHIKQGSSFSIFLLMYFILYYFFVFFEKNYLFSRIKNNHFKLIYLILFLLFFVKNTPNNFYFNIFNFKERLTSYIEMNDYEYLNGDEIKLIDRLKFVTKTEKCFQIFTYETAIQYYLGKPTCTKFSHIMNMGPKANQLLFITQINDKKPKYLLIGGTYQNIGNMKGRNNLELSPTDRFKYIDKYIADNFETYEVIGKWTIIINKD